MMSQPQCHSAGRRIMSMKNSSNTIGNRTRDLPFCSAMPQATAPLRSPLNSKYGLYINFKKRNLACSSASLTERCTVLCVPSVLQNIPFHFYWLLMCSGSVCISHCCQIASGGERLGGHEQIQDEWQNIT
jgi:hypothetical protein